MDSPADPHVLVACPDARPPAYQAVVGLGPRRPLLHSFQTAFYYRGDDPLSALGRRVAPARAARWQRALRRRHDPEIPPARVGSAWSYDLALRLENRLGGRRPHARREIARWRTRRFDRTLARVLDARPPGAALVFSDVGSEFSLPLCRRLGIPAILSMVHGDVREEREVLEREAEAAPDFFRLYLGDGASARPRRGNWTGYTSADCATSPWPTASSSLPSISPSSSRVTGRRARRSR